MSISEAHGGAHSGWFNERAVFNLQPLYTQELPVMSTELCISYWHLLDPSADSHWGLQESLARLSPDDVGRFKALRTDLLSQGIIGRHLPDSSHPGRLIILVRPEDPASAIPARERTDAYGQPVDIVMAAQGRDRSPHHETMLHKDLALLQRVRQIAHPDNPNQAAETEAYTAAFRASHNLLHSQRNYSDEHFIPPTLY